ncbi:MAG: gamma-glutamyl-gamma-aminobutyrate hydrolase family protein [Alphaproteobacteria bacterium]
MSIPLIGVTLDWEPPGGYSKFPWYALRENYCAAVVRAGGLPVPLAHEAALVNAFLDRLDGLIVTGGAFDLDPALFGADQRHASVTTKDRRTGFELALARAALARDLPVLGICGGEQLLAVALGGTLIQHIPDAVPDALAHEQPNPRDEPGHDIIIAPDTRLHRILGTDRLAVNSAHHQAVAAVPDGVIVNARAPDGVIEGIETDAHRFCVGVQWHPEFEITEGDRRLFAALIEAAR